MSNIRFRTKGPSDSKKNTITNPSQILSFKDVSHVFKILSVYHDRFSNNYFVPCSAKYLFNREIINTSSNLKFWERLQGDISTPSGWVVEYWADPTTVDLLVMRATSIESAATFVTFFPKILTRKHIP